MVCEDGGRRRHTQHAVRRKRRLSVPTKIKDWSLIIIMGRGGGGLQNGGGGGACEVLPLRKGGGGTEKVLAMLKGGHKMFWGSFYAVPVA